VDASIITGVWDRLTGTQPDPPPWLVLADGLAAVAAVVHRPTWRVTRNVATIAHEGGHAFTAVVTGRRLYGIRLHSDTSGLTLSRGSPTGPGMVATAAAGYLTPPVLGLAGAWLLAAGHLTATLWAALALLAAMLAAIRNAYGAVAVLATGLVILGVSLLAPENIQAAFGYLAIWFMLVAGLRPVVELQRQRRRGRAPASDADQLARLTGVPPALWVVLFGIVAVGALIAGARLLIPAAPLHL
jgi:Peptidase M50B-like